MPAPHLTPEVLPQQVPVWDFPLAPHLTSCCPSWLGPEDRDSLWVALAGGGAEEVSAEGFPREKKNVPQSIAILMLWTFQGPAGSLT